MASKTIEELDSRGTVVSTDTMLVSVGGVAKKATVAEVLATADLPNTMGALTVTGNGTVGGDLAIAGDLNLTGGTLTFPATQVPSSDPNTLDDYEEGTWTPVFTFATPGDLVATPSLAQGYYIKIGSFVFCTFALIHSTFTHSTASGAASITGLPFPNHDASVFGVGELEWRGITKANYTDVNVRVTNSSVLLLQASGSGQATTSVTSVDMPSGGTVNFRGSAMYRAA